MRWRLGLLILAFATVVGLGGMDSVAQVGAPVGAEQAASPSDETAQMKELLLKLNEENNKLEEQLTNISSRSDAETKYSESYWKFHSDRLGRYAKYDQSLMDRVGRVLDWQETASNIVLYLMLFIAVAGVLFSGFQLYVASKKGFELTQSNMTVEAGKFQLNTSVIGLIILFVSMFYLYLFLKEVYTIKPLDFGGALSAAQSDKGAVVPPNPQATK